MTTEQPRPKRISASAIMAGAKSMSAMHAALTKPSAPTASMSFGTLVHAYILQRDEKPWIVYPSTRRGKKWDAFKKANQEARIVIQSEMDALCSIDANIKATTIAECLEKAEKRESWLKWEEPGIGGCIGIADAHGGGLLLDLKLTRFVSRHAVRATIMEARYDLQIAWYRRGLRASGEDASQCGIVPVESSKPYAAGNVHWFDDQELCESEAECLSIAMKYRDWLGTTKEELK